LVFSCFCLAGREQGEDRKRKNSLISKPPISIGVKMWADVGRISCTYNRGQGKNLDSTGLEQDDEKLIK